MDYWHFWFEKIKKKFEQLWFTLSEFPIWTTLLEIGHNIFWLVFLEFQKSLEISIIQKVICRYLWSFEYVNLHAYCLPWVVNSLVQLSHRSLFLVHKSYWYVLKYYRTLDLRVVGPLPIHRLAGNSIRLVCMLSLSSSSSSLPSPSWWWLLLMLKFFFLHYYENEI